MLNAGIHINFDYALSDNIMVKMKAHIICNYEEPCYVVSGLEVINTDKASNFPADIRILPLVHNDHILWVHADSLRSSILSKAIGEAIEATGSVEMLHKSDAA